MAERSQPQAPRVESGQETDLVELTLEEKNTYEYVPTHNVHVHTCCHVEHFTDAFSTDISASYVNEHFLFVGTEN